jgi:hypothetical protein
MSLHPVPAELIPNSERWLEVHPLADLPRTERCLPERLRDCVKVKRATLEGRDGEADAMHSHGVAELHA